MSDITYSVVVEFLQRGSLDPGSAGLNKLSAKTDEWGKKLFGTVGSFAGKFNSTLDSLAGTALSAGASVGSALGAGLATGIVAATTVAFHFNEELERTQISLAAIANANGIVPNIGNGMRMSADVIKKMRVDAALLPGEFKDLENIMATIMSPMAQLGNGMSKTEELAKDTMAAAAILNVPMATAGRELAMILEGNARHNMPFFNRLGLNMSTAEVNKMDPSKRLSLVQGRLSALVDPLQEVMGNSFTGLKTTAKDKIRSGVGALFGTTFASAETFLQRFNNFVAGNRGKFFELGEKLSDGIDYAFRHGVESMLAFGAHWGPIALTFGKNLFHHLHDAWIRFEPVVDRLLGKVESFMKDPQAFSKIVHLASMLLALRAGTGVLEHGAGMMPGILSGIGGSGGMMAGFAELAGVVPFAAASLAIFAAGVYGLTNVLTDTSNFWHSLAVSELSSIRDNAEKTGTSLAELQKTLKPVEDAIGVMMLTAVASAAEQFRLVAEAARMSTEAWVAVATALNPFKSLKADPKLNPEDPELLRTPFSYNGTQSIRAMDAYNFDPEKDRKVPVTNVHIQNLNIHVNSNQDPNRIAKKTWDLAKDEMRRPKTAFNSGIPRLTDT